MTFEESENDRAKFHAEARTSFRIHDVCAMIICFRPWLSIAHRLVLGGGSLTSYISR